MKRKLILIFCLTIFLFITLSICVAFGLKGEKALKNHPEFVSIEDEWGEKLGTYYLVNLTEDRTLEFFQIDSNSGGGKYACLSKIGEFELREDVRYINESIKNNRESWSPYARFSDLSYALGIKIETMVDVVNHYDEILTFVKMVANEQYISDDYVYHVNTEDKKATIWIWKLHGYFHGLWHGVKEDEIPFNADWGESLCVRCYGENWREKLNADLPKIRKSLGLE